MNSNLTDLEKMYLNLSLYKEFIIEESVVSKLILTRGFIITIVYIMFCIFLGSINCDKVFKKYSMIALSFVYNFFVGKESLLLLQMMYFFFINLPKGPGYYVPESDRIVNMILGTLTLIICLLLLIPINIYFKKKSDLNMKQYLMISFFSGVIGMLLK